MRHQHEMDGNVCTALITSIQKKQPNGHVRLTDLGISIIRKMFRALYHELCCNALPPFKKVAFRPDGSARLGRSHCFGANLTSSKRKKVSVWQYLPGLVV
jgi:hypothetical protein